MCVCSLVFCVILCLLYELPAVMFIRGTWATVVILLYFVELGYDMVKSGVTRLIWYAHSVLPSLLSLGSHLVGTMNNYTFGLFSSNRNGFLQLPSFPHHFSCGKSCPGSSSNLFRVPAPHLYRPTSQLLTIRALSVKREDIEGTHRSVPCGFICGIMGRT